jgi:NADPH:quinone reductase-like Zn-dependent oxidoreductase
MENYTCTPAEALYYVNALFSLLVNGTLKTQIFKEHPFTAEGVKQAQIDLTSGKSIGKLVVKVSD